MIRTPDQRLRVFVSSTLQELREERNAAREAISNLRLTPVLFELGARPYPPRTLYRAYLEQSHVFIGIYWQQYGWIAPDMEVSGVEDEYRLSAEMPRLIYIREPAPERDARLSRLLDQVKQDGRASYKSFQSPAELRTLVEEDLALLLSERFEGSRRRDQPIGEGSRSITAAVPMPASRFIGREREVQIIRELLVREDTRLVSLTGLGGVGKTRLALAVANQLQERFPDGVGVVFLDAISAPGMVLPALVQALGLQESSERPPIEALKHYLGERAMLLVLDNFEHVIAAAPSVGELLKSCPRLKILVTSREALQISGEHHFEVPPLAVPAGPDHATAGVDQSDSVRLFVDRARAVRGDFQLDDTTTPAVVEIVRRLEGLPLAIELAAARVRMLPVDAILRRLTGRLGMLTGGARDLPRRQQTLRNTLDWSYDLLDERDRAFFARLGVFVGGWTLDAAETVCAPESDDALEAVSSLIDKSLVRSDGFVGDEPRFSMLEIVREYAAERLSERGETELRRARHAEYFHALAGKGATEVITGPQEQRLERYAAETGNIHAAMRWLLDRGAAGQAARFGRALWDCWWLWSRLQQAISWMEEILSTREALANEERAMAEMVLGSAVLGLGDRERSLLHLRQAYALYRDLGNPLAIAVARTQLGSALGMTEDPAEGEHMLRAALATYKGSRQPWGIGIVYATWGLAQVLLRQGRGAEAIPSLEEVANWAQRMNERLTLAITLTHLGMTRLNASDLPGARSVLIEALELSRGLDFRARRHAALHWDANPAAILIWSLEALAALAVATANPEEGAVLFGAAEGVRRSIGVATWAPDQRMHERTEHALRAALGDDAFAANFSKGTRISLEQVSKVAATLGTQPR